MSVQPTPDFPPPGIGAERAERRIHAIVVVHQEAMVAEGIAAALNRYPGIAVVEAATNMLELERWEGRADAFVLDPTLPRAQEAMIRLRTRGARVVLVGDGDPIPGELSVSLKLPISALVRALVPGHPGGRSRGRLTAREDEVLSLAASGLTANQIGRRLGISSKTVEQRKQRAYVKLGVSNQAAAIGAWMGAVRRSDTAIRV